MKITIHIHTGNDFVRNHGRKVKAAGGSYARARPSDHCRAVTLPFTGEGDTLRLANELLATYGYVWTSGKFPIDVHYNSAKVPQYVRRQYVHWRDPNPVLVAVERARQRWDAYCKAIRETEKSLIETYYKIDTAAEGAPQ